MATHAARTSKIHNRIGEALRGQLVRALAGNQPRKANPMRKRSRPRKDAPISSVLRHEVAKRLKAGVSINALAHAAGIPQPSLHRWVAPEEAKSSRKSISLDVADKLAVYLGLKLVAD